MDKIASIVIPLRIKSVKEDALNRLKRLLDVIPECFEVIVVDDGSSVKSRKEIIKIAKAASSEYIYLSTRWKSFSLARSRNVGAGSATTDVVIFHDVDFFGSTEIYQRIAAEIISRKLADKPENFFCIPVAFMTEEGTEKYFKGQSNNIDWIYNKKLARKEWVNFVVDGSSCIVTNREDLLEMGGHDETYYGHGAEDFELLHRLGAKFPIAEKPEHYAENMGSGDIKEYKGFRAYFALYGQECRAQGCVLIHIYHPKRRGWGYYKHKRNFKKLRKLMQG